MIRLAGKGSGWSVKPGQVDAIDFTANQNIKINGISMFGTTRITSKSLNGLILLKETSSQAVVAFGIFQYTASGGTDYYDQMFSSPGSITAGKKYTITVEYFTTATIYEARDGLASASASCNGVTVNFAFSDSSDDNNGSKVARGQIPRILLGC